MQMQQVRYFLALCEEHNFSRAARRCGVRQPTLTQSIKQLESELGGALFERGGRTSSLTAPGAAVRPHIASAAAALERARCEAAAFAGGAPLPPAAFDVSLQPKENAMRKALFLAAVIAVLLLAVGVVSQVPHAATATRAAGKTNDVYAIEKSVDLQHLPRIQPPTESEE